jgi:hypothetical protein
MDNDGRANQASPILNANREMKHQLDSLRSLVCDLLKANQELREALDTGPNNESQYNEPRAYRLQRPSQPGALSASAFHPEVKA